MHAPHSLDLALSGYRLFQHLQDFLDSIHLVLLERLKDHFSPRDNKGPAMVGLWC